MTLLDRYLLRQFIATMLGLVLGLPLLFVVADVTDNLDKYLSRGIPPRDVALSYLYFFPQAIYWALPIAGLVATVFTIGNMTRHQEITAAKAGGVSFYRLIAPLLVMAALLSVAAVALGEVIPGANQRRFVLVGERQFTTGTLRTNFVFQTETGYTLSARRLDAESDQMAEIVLERDGAADAPAVHLVARRATWRPDTGWVLGHGYYRSFDTTAVERLFEFDSARVASLKETPEELLARPKDPEEMRYGEMERFMETIRRSGGDTRKLEVELAQKISLPMAILVIVLFGAPLSTSTQRGGAAYGVGISLAVTMIYLLLFRVGTAVGASGAVPPLVAAWAPNALFLLGGIYLMARVRT